MLTEQELSKLDMADGELRTPLSTTPTEDFNPLAEDPDDFIRRPTAGCYSFLSAQRPEKEFESLTGKTVQLVNEQTSCHQAIAESLTELKSSAMELQERVVQAIKQVTDKFYCEDMANFDDNKRNHLLNLYKETMLKGYNFGFEKLSKRFVNFAKEWMAFVTEKCEKGRGMRPKNLPLSMLYQCRLWQTALFAVSFIAGRTCTGKFNRFTSNISNKSSLSEPTQSSAAESRVKRHSMDYHSEVEIHEGDDGGIVLDIHAKKNRGGETEDLKWMDRRKQAIVRLEIRRQVSLRDSGGHRGRYQSQNRARLPHQFSQSQIQKAEGTQGLDEMLVFMEYCDCGTLDEATKASLPEHNIFECTHRRFYWPSITYMIPLPYCKLTERGSCQPIS
uniref:Mitogen-activated protein kinase kinase kinase N-terminal domain-containing protein n=1 Tax=Magallana gigas TaxID=29159 RepID=A0A8W8JGJ8_MAGGI